MLDHLKTMVGVAAVTFALSASLSAAMTNDSPDDRGGPPTATPAAVVADTPAPGDTSDVDSAQGDTEDTAAAGVDGGDGEAGCVEALTEHAQSRDQLQAHVDDEDFPDGGAAGNQNALDHQCGGAFAETDAQGATEPTPEAVAPSNSDEAPGHSGETHGNGNGNPKP